MRFIVRIHIKNDTDYLMDGTLNRKGMMTNYYNNQTVEVNVMGELRTFENNTEESSSNFYQILIYILLVAITIFIIITIFLSLKLHKSNKVNIIEFNKNSAKKYNTGKPKKKGNKNKKKYSGKKPKNKKSKDTKTKNTKKVTQISSKSSGYCGYCGKSVSTPYCKKCGNKV